MNEREIGTGASCFLIKDERIIGDWYSTPTSSYKKRNIAIASSRIALRKAHMPLGYTLMT